MNEEQLRECVSAGMTQEEIAAKYLVPCRNVAIAMVTLGIPKGRTLSEAELRRQASEGKTWREISQETGIKENRIAATAVLLGIKRRRKHYPPNVRQVSGRTAQLLTELKSRQVMDIGDVALALRIERTNAEMIVARARGRGLIVNTKRRWDAKLVDHGPAGVKMLPWAEYTLTPRGVDALTKLAKDAQCLQ